MFSMVFMKGFEVDFVIVVVIVFMVCICYVKFVDVGGMVGWVSYDFS